MDEMYEMHSKNLRNYDFWNVREYQPDFKGNGGNWMETIRTQISVIFHIFTATTEGCSSVKRYKIGLIAVMKRLET